MIVIMDYHSTRAFVLSKESSRENDSTYHFFSEDFGHLSLKAKGTRQILAKLPGHLEIPSLCKIDFIQGHFPRLVSAIEENPYLAIKKSLSALTVSFRICRLVDNFIPFNQADPDIWQLLNNIFYLMESNLDNYPKIIDFAWFYFNAQFLRLIGATPFLDGCVICGQQSDVKFFSFSAKGLVCKLHRHKDDLPISSDQKRVLKSLFDWPLTKFSQKSSLETVLKEKKFIQNFLEQFTSIVKSDIM